MCVFSSAKSQPSFVMRKINKIFTVENISFIKYTKFLKRNFIFEKHHTKNGSQKLHNIDIFNTLRNEMAVNQRFVMNLSRTKLLNKTVLLS